PDAERIATAVMTRSLPGLIHATGYTGGGYSMAFELVLLPVRSSGDRCDRLLGSVTPVGNAAWLGGALIDSFAMERALLLNEGANIPTGKPDDDCGPEAPTALRVRSWAQAMLERDAEKCARFSGDIPL